MEVYVGHGNVPLKGKRINSALKRIVEHGWNELWMSMLMCGLNGVCNTPPYACVFLLEKEFRKVFSPRSTKTR